MCYLFICAIYFYWPFSSTSPESDHIVYILVGISSKSQKFQLVFLHHQFSLYFFSTLKTCLLKVAPKDFSRDGKSLLFIDNDAILINGGTQKSIARFTGKILLPSKCGLGSECSIDGHPVSRIPQIFCDGKCQGWFHMPCINFNRIPKGDFSVNNA